jgi:hypothetical protein
MKNILGRISCSTLPVLMIIGGFSEFGIIGGILLSCFAGILLFIIWGMPDDLPPTFKKRK